MECILLSAYFYFIKAKVLKRWKREWKLELIEELDPEWTDLRAFAKFEIPAFCSIPPLLSSLRKQGSRKSMECILLSAYFYFIKAKVLKRWKREWKIEFIEKMNREWNDLYYELSGE